MFAKVEFGGDLLATVAQAFEGTMSQIAIQYKVNADDGEPAVNQHKPPQSLDFGQNLLERSPHALHAYVCADCTAARKYLAKHI